MKQKVSLKTQQETPSELNKAPEKQASPSTPPNTRAESPSDEEHASPSTATDTRAESPGDLGETAGRFVSRAPKSCGGGGGHRKRNKASRTSFITLREKAVNPEFYNQQNVLQKNWRWNKDIFRQTNTERSCHTKKWWKKFFRLKEGNIRWKLVESKERHPKSIHVPWLGGFRLLIFFNLKNWLLKQKKNSLKIWNWY